MRFIGDVHGKYGRYKKLIKAVDQSIQVGDLGVGFRYHGESAVRFGKAEQNPPYDTMVRQNARFIRGNHDNPRVCEHHSQWIPDGSVEQIGNSKVMFVGGALSIDIYRRMEGFSWWPDEELSISRLNDVVDTYSEMKPDVMVTHECPEQVAALLNHSFKLDKPSATRQAFESMFEIHKPGLWIFGHWHHSFRMNIYGTEFVCLAELETLDVDL